MGGRIASQVAAADGDGIAALVFLGYPLHPPGNPAKMRDAHLPDIKAPMLFMQGTRDSFGAPDELREVIKTAIAGHALSHRRRRPFVQGSQERSNDSRAGLRIGDG